MVNEDMVLFVIMVGGFIALCVAAANDPRNKLDNPDVYDDAEDWHGL